MFANAETICPVCAKRVSATPEVCVLCGANLVTVEAPANQGLIPTFTLLNVRVIYSRPTLDLSWAGMSA